MDAHGNIHECCERVEELERICRDIYLNYHISMLRGVPPSVIEAWNVGQRVYELNKPVPPEEK